MQTRIRTCAERRRSMVRIKKDEQVGFYFNNRKNSKKQKKNTRIDQPPGITAGNTPDILLNDIRSLIEKSRKTV
jgi:hypothetical protein